MEWILFGTTVACAIGWIVTRISLITMLWYLTEKKYPFPNSEELKKGTSYAIKHFWKK